MDYFKAEEFAAGGIVYFTQYNFIFYGRQKPEGVVMREAIVAFVGRKIRSANTKNKSRE